MDSDRDRANHTRLGPGLEFDLVRRLLDRWGTMAVGIGDDAAVLEVPPGQCLVVSVDTSTEGVHFRRTWLTPREIGYRATAAAVSDLAAMAASPCAMLVAATIPVHWMDDAAALADGIGDASRDAACPIVGGDTTRGECLALTIVVLGSAARPVRRSGARPGDVVFATGRFGAPGAAVAAMAGGENPDPAHRVRFAHPVPRLAEARWLAEQGATAMIDVSDGLASDARHLAAASGVSIAIDLDRLPRFEGVPAIDAVRSGEEYELLLAAPADLSTANFTARFGLPLTAIGRVSRTGVPDVSFTLGGERVDPGSGYDHFSR